MKMNIETKYMKQPKNSYPGGISPIYKVLMRGFKTPELKIPLDALVAYSSLSCAYHIYTKQKIYILMVMFI